MSLIITPETKVGALLDAYPAVRAYLVDADGTVRVQGRG